MFSSLFVIVQHKKRDNNNCSAQKTGGETQGENSAKFEQIQ